MDTKLKKTHKLTVFIIALVTLVPALILTALYPKMEKEYLEKYSEYKSKQEQSSQNSAIVGLWGNFANYATEASYFLYGSLIEEAVTDAGQNFDVLYEYGWDSDYEDVEANTQYFARYTTDDGNVFTTQNAEEDLSGLLDNPSDEMLEEWKAKGAIGYLVVNFDKYGRPYNISFTDLTDGNLAYVTGDVYDDVKASVKQYENNVKAYNEVDGVYGKIYSKDLLPKNFNAVFLVDGDSDFVWNQSGTYYSYVMSPEQIYVDNGVVYIIAALVVAVALAALLLPFIRSLDTGWERIFSMHLETNLIIVGLGIGGAYCMFEAMCHSNYTRITEVLANHSGMKILGYGINPDALYWTLLVLNFIGWAILFFMEYAVVSNFRQFVCLPKNYIKNNLFIVKFMRWCVKKVHVLIDWFSRIDLTDNLQKSILKIVGINFVIVTLLCTLWFAGLFGVIVYSVILYVILTKCGKKIRRQYQSVLDATEKMANGNLKITLDEDLGIFAPLGEKLEQINESFAKAVHEEVKSQNMKTELITNVSHDLKTPLTAIITYIDLLKQDNVSEETRKSYIQTLDQKSQRLKALIEDLFEISKANSGNVKMNFMDVDVVNLMKQVRLELEDKIADSDLTFRWNLPEEKVILKLDGQRTYRVFDNLINNILKYAMPYSRVYVDITDSEDKVQVIFRNISATELDYNVEHLTERFVRGDVSRNSEGSGLGLAIVKSFVELQNGIFKIEVDGDLFKAIIIWQK